MNRDTENYWEFVERYGGEVSTNLHYARGELSPEDQRTFAFRFAGHRTVAIVMAELIRVMEKVKRKL